MSSSVVVLGLYCAIAGAALSYTNAMQYGWGLLTVGVVVMVLAGSAGIFAAFCYLARPLVRSPIMMPYVAVKLQLNMLSTVLAYAQRGFKPLFPEWTLPYELLCTSMRYMLETYGDVVADENAALMREPFAMHGRMILKSNCREHNTIPEELDVNGMKHFWMRDPERENKPHRIVVIHFHGGGYAISDPLQDVELANQTHTMLQQILKDKYTLDVSVDVLLANYRKSPENPYPTPMNDCLDMYQYVLKHEGVSPKQVVLSGDSCGAEMSFSNCMRLRDENRVEELPLAALLYSMVVDFSEKGGDDKTLHCILPASFVDPVLETYLRTVKDDPEAFFKVSPTNHSLVGLPPIFLQYGTLERFYEQGLRFMEKAKKQGVTDWELDVLQNMPHDPVMFPSMLSPYANRGIHAGCEFAAKHVANMLKSSAPSA